VSWLVPLPVHNASASGQRNAPVSGGDAGAAWTARREAEAAPENGEFWSMVPMVLSGASNR
jgi:hypothetical protein